jgi:hypothetical protein
MIDSKARELIKYVTEVGELAEKVEELAKLIEPNKTHIHNHVADLQLALLIN